MENMDHNVVCRKEGVVLCLSGFEMDQILHTPRLIQALGHLNRHSAGVLWFSFGESFRRVTSGSSLLEQNEKGDGRPERQDIVCSVCNRIRRVHEHIVRDGLYMI